jgi:hypothetical protein
LEQLQIDLDLWLEDYNNTGHIRGSIALAKTPMQTFLDSRQLAWDKILDRRYRPLRLLPDYLLCQIKF